MATTTSSTTIHQPNSITFDDIINTKLIDDLDKTIAAAKKSLSSTSQPQSEDNIPAANVADDKEPGESITNGNGGSIHTGILIHHPDKTIVDAQISSSSTSLPQKDNTKDKENLTRPLNGKLEKLSNDLKYIKESLSYLREYEKHVVTPFETVSHRVKHIVAQISSESLESLVTGKTLDSQFSELDKILMDMKIHIPSSNKMYTSAANVEARRSTLAATKKMCGDSDSDELELPVLQSNDKFSSNPAFLYIKEVYNSLRDFQCKLCLLCFSIFPEDVIVKKRILIYWWIGEGLISDTKTGDKAADEILIELVNKGFIEPVDQKYREVANSFWMHPLIRSAVIVLSKQVGFFDFDDRGKPTLDFVSSRRACLVGVGASFKLTKTILRDRKDENSNNSSKSEENDQAKQEENSKSVEKIRAKQEEGSNNGQLNQEKLNTLYNVNEQYLKLEPEWFLKLKNVQVLQLGRWMNSAENHIEVEDVEFLKMLQNMKHLLYFSLQGISRISELPDTIGNLTNLRILDLRACHNLEILPKNICSLKYLAHLDMSECYLLESLPEEISSLSNLQVLKGFVIGDPHGRGNPCTLDDLKALKVLRKLSIRTGSKYFPKDEEVKAIQQFTALRNLKIIWGGNSLKKSIDADGQDDDSKKDGHRATLSARKLIRSRKVLRLFSKSDPNSWRETQLPRLLKKLDLQCFPHRKRPSWLNPSHLSKLKKLYIRGGRLSDLLDEDEKWTVETLCLKHLNELTMDWTERQEHFPELKYLEAVQCPKLTFFPCDDKGVWTK